MRGTHGLAYAILIFAVLGCVCGKNLESKNGSSQPAPASGNTSVAQPGRPEIDGMPVYKTNEPVAVGYMGYQVFDSWYTKKLSNNEYLNQAPDATYLFIDLGVVNNDKEGRTVPPFKLIDENNAEYDASSKAWAAEGSIGLLTDLNPRVSKRAYVIFDVPTDRKYRLKVSGGYWSSSNALIELTPSVKKK